MSFKTKMIIETDVVVCVLKSYKNKKAWPVSVQFEAKYNECHSKINYLNELNLPGKPASFWIDRDYEVYSSLTDDGFWFQICLSNKPEEEKKSDISDYKESFLSESEPSMCTEPTCHAYMTFDLCEHTLSEEYHYMLYDYTI